MDDDLYEKEKKKLNRVQEGWVGLGERVLRRPVKIQHDTINRHD